MKFLSTSLISIALATISTALTTGTASASSEKTSSTAGSLSFSTPRLGSGIVRPAREHAVFVNPAALGNSPIAVEGGWSFDRKRPLIYGVGNYRSVGFGGGFRRDGMANVFEAGVGVDITDRFSAGLAFNLYDNELDGHAAVNYRATSALELGLVARYIASGVTRLDFGVAYLGSGFGLEADWKQVLRDGEHAAYFNLGASTQVSRVGLLLGFDFNVYKGDFRGGTLQAGIGFDLSSRWTLRGYYRPEPMESGQGNWLLTAIARF